jgi:hypothetical protein
LLLEAVHVKERAIALLLLHFERVFNSCQSMTVQDVLGGLGDLAMLATVAFGFMMSAHAMDQVCPPLSPPPFPSPPPSFRCRYSATRPAHPPPPPPPPAPCVAARRICFLFCAARNC